MEEVPAELRSGGETRPGLETGAGPEPGTGVGSCLNICPSSTTGVSLEGGVVVETVAHLVHIMLSLSHTRQLRAIFYRRTAYEQCIVP